MTDLLDTGPARLTIPVLTLRGLTVFPQLPPSVLWRRQWRKIRRFSL